MDTYILIAAIAVIVAVWFIYASRPLHADEVDEFGRRRRLVAVEAHYSFTEAQAAVNPNFKSSMDAMGRLYHMDEAVNHFPSLAAGLLKWKKHEWIIFAFARDRRVIAAWMNKGPDNENVWPLIHYKTLVETAKELSVDTVLEFHNHPNPDPGKLIASLPSPQDHRHANSFGSIFVSNGINYLSFIAERGRHFQYACWIPENFLPLDSFLKNVQSQNGTSRIANFRLRRQHRTYSRLASLLQYKDASENIGFICNRQATQTTSFTSVVQPTPRPFERKPIPKPALAPSVRLALKPVQSSNLLAVGYDPSRQLLEVAFRNGTVYQYSGVPEDEYNGLISAPSKGKYFNTRIVRGGYNFLQVV